MGAGKTTTLKAISNLLRAERGDVTKGSVEFKGNRVDQLSPNELVKRGVIQVMEGRHCFAHLTLEENLLTGAYTRSISRSGLKDALEKVYHYFPRLKTRRGTQAGYTSGGEQQMCAIGRALMAKPEMILLDEPSMGLAPQVVEEIFGIVKDLNQQENVSFLLAEQNTHDGAALRRFRLHPGKWPGGDGRATPKTCAATKTSRSSISAFPLAGANPSRMSSTIAVANAGFPENVGAIMTYYDSLETNNPVEREQDLMGKLARLVSARRGWAS
jgi:ABC-type branched-subunit amino acid transport system ATPase component